MDSDTYVASRDGLVSQRDGHVQQVDEQGQRLFGDEMGRMNRFVQQDVQDGVERSGQEDFARVFVTRMGGDRQTERRPQRTRRIIRIIPTLADTGLNKWNTSYKLNQMKCKFQLQSITIG